MFLFEDVGLFYHIQAKQMLHNGCSNKELCHGFTVFEGESYLQHASSIPLPRMGLVNTDWAGQEEPAEAFSLWAWAVQLHQLTCRLENLCPAHCCPELPSMAWLPDHSLCIQKSAAHSLWLHTQ